jgi:hypothetical protein
MIYVGNLKKSAYIGIISLAKSKIFATFAFTCVSAVMKH